MWTDKAQKKKLGGPNLSRLGDLSVRDVIGIQYSMIFSSYLYLQQVYIIIIPIILINNADTTVTMYAGCRGSRFCGKIDYTRVSQTAAAAYSAELRAYYIIITAGRDDDDDVNAYDFTLCSMTQTTTNNNNNSTCPYCITCGVLVTYLLLKYYH